MNRVKKFLIGTNERYKKYLRKRTPQMNLVLGFFMYTVIGFILLSIPWFHKTSISWLDNLFISTSAVSTTGLVTISIFDAYNFMGQLIILSLFQIGGIGYMTLTTYYLLFTTKNIGQWHHKIIGAEFTLPSSIRIKDFIKSVIVFTLIMETLGSIAFFIAFQKAGMPTLQAIWYGIFHSVSSFCTAGFSLFNDSFVQFSGDGYMNTIIAVLAISGSMGFIVITDIWCLITRKSKSISFTTKIITYGFVILLLSGTCLVYFLEPSVNGTEQPLLTSFFQAMTAMTTVGLNTIATSNLSLPILLFVIFLMYIGASPSGTAGGLKITTLTAMFSILKSRLLGEKQVTFLGKIIPIERLFVATSTFMLYTSIIFLFTFLLTLSEDFAMEKILFEVSSALGTVGLSTGITGELSAIGKILIIILMFVGRVGVLTFGFALLETDHTEEKPTECDLAV